MAFLQHIKPSVKELNPYTVIGKPITPDLIKLNQNENPFDVPDEIKREILDNFFVSPWNRYPDVLPHQLTAALSNHIGIDEEYILAANGSNELMYTILMAVVSKGTKVLIPTPTFFLYQKIVGIFEGIVVNVPAKDDLSFDVANIVQTAQKENPSIIILNSPNSPTGQMLSTVDVETIISSTDAIVLVDEAYIEFAAQPSVVSLLEKYDRLIILRTFSKAFSLAGLRIGYLLARPGLCAELKKPKIPFTVNNFSALAAITLMKNSNVISEKILYIKKQMEFLFDNLSRISKVKVFPSQTNFLIFRVNQNAETIFKHLLRENILVRDISAYPMLENMLRVNAGTEQENKAFISALSSCL